MRRRIALLGTLAAALLVVPAVASADPSPVSVVQTGTSLAAHLSPEPAIHFATKTPAPGTPLITINERQTYQHVTGFGAAMTDSSAYLIENDLPLPTRTSLMEALFGPTGLRLGLVRVPIAASDFTATEAPYSYDDVPAGKRDPHLVHFSIKHDRSYILPALEQAHALNPQAEFLATPWSPPAWMKGNDSLSNVHDAGTLRGAAYGPWAAYIVKFLQDYAAAGVPISAMTAQNEPGNPTSYPGLNLSEPAEATWISQDLAPALKRAKLAVKVYGNDSGWASATFAQAEATSVAAPDLAGIAWHCYYGSPNVMSTVHDEHPGLDTIVSECSPGISAIPTPEVVISSLRNWASSVALWNLALNPAGGPVEPPDSGCPGCYGLATIYPKKGTATLGLPYYQLGQASEFIESGAVRVASNTFVSYDYSKPAYNFISAGLDDVAMINPDGSRVLLVYNNAEEPITFAVAWHGSYFTTTIPAGATTTYVWDKPPASGGASMGQGS